MTAPSTQTLQRLPNETGLQAGTLEKVLRLLDVLQEIARPYRHVIETLDGGVTQRTALRRDSLPIGN